MNNKQKITENINEDWSDSKSISDICVKILDFISRKPLVQLEHMTQGSLKSAIRNQYSDADFLSAVQYLAGSKVSLLEIKFEFIEDDFIFQIDDSVIKEAIRDGYLAHPSSGELVDDFEEKVFLYFRPGHLAKQISKKS